MKLETLITPITILLCFVMFLVQQGQQHATLLKEHRALFDRLPDMALKSYDFVRDTETQRARDAKELAAKWDAEWKAKQELEAALKRIPADVTEPKRTLAARELIRIEREDKARIEDQQIDSMGPKVRDALRAARQ